MIAFMAWSSTTYTPKWRSGETMVIRVPTPLVPQVMEYARKLDRKCPPDKQIVLPGVEISPKLRRSKPVNVASVPLRSPFRYPGGKTWLVPYVLRWLSSIRKPEVFVEPFAGGGIVSLTAAFEDLANHVVMAEIDECVSGVWQTILSGQAEWLARRILAFDLTKDNVVKALSRSNRKNLTLKERAFLTVLRNRVQRGGIMAPGAGLVKAGENNKGIASRWYPQTLARRIRQIAQNSAKISFFNGDGFLLFDHFGGDRKSAFFVDPPYTKAAKRLYNNWQFDHRRLFGILRSLRADYLATYDNTPQIRELADEFGLDYRPVRMKNTHHAQMTELLIGKDFEWFDAIAE